MVEMGLSTVMWLEHMKKADKAHTFVDCDKEECRVQGSLNHLLFKS